MSEDINNLKISIVKIETKIDNIEEAVGEIKTALTKYIEEADKKYASKAVEKEVEGLRDNQKWVVRLVVGAVIASLLGIILVK